MRYPFIGFDIDDVCFHSFHVIAETIMEWYGKELAAPTNFSIPTQFPDMNPDDIYDAIDYALVEKYDKMEPVHGAIAFLRKYQEYTGNTIMFVTSRNPARKPELKEATEKLLEKWLSDIDYKIYFPKSEGRSKADLCDDFCFDLFIEDRIKYCLEISDRGRLSLLMTRPWNKRFIDSECIHRIVRVGNYYDVNLIFESMYRSNR